MRRILADSRDTVMAGATRSQDLRVIDNEGRCPYIRRVAILTNDRRRDMCRALTGRLHAIVAADAITRDIDVVEIGGQPSGRRMAVVTIVAARNMGRVLAGSNNAIVT